MWAIVELKFRRCGKCIHMTSIGRHLDIPKDNICRNSITVRNRHITALLVGKGSRACTNYNPIQYIIDEEGLLRRVRITAKILLTIVSFTIFASIMVYSSVCSCWDEPHADDYLCWKTVMGFVLFILLLYFNL